MELKVSFLLSVNLRVAHLYPLFQASDFDQHFSIPLGLPLDLRLQALEVTGNFLFILGATLDFLLERLVLTAQFRGFLGQGLSLVG